MKRTLIHTHIYIALTFQNIGFKQKIEKEIN